MTPKISAQLEQVITQLLPLIDRMRSIDWDPTPPDRNAEVATVRALLTIANQKLLGVPTAEAGREVAQKIADAVHEGVARWSNGDRADAALVRADALHDDALRLLQGP